MHYQGQTKKDFTISHQLCPRQQRSIVIRHVPPTIRNIFSFMNLLHSTAHISYQQEAPTVPAPTYARKKRKKLVKSSTHQMPIRKFRAIDCIHGPPCRTAYHREPNIC